MKKAAIISVGSELMKGKMDDTNSTYISKWLHEKGITVKWRLSVSDEIEDIADALKVASVCNLVVLTGGLGPTDDDCTREAVSMFLNEPLILDEDMWSKLEKMFMCKFKSTPISNKKQAEMIKGGSFLENRVGTAPGIEVFKNNTFR